MLRNFFCCFVVSVAVSLSLVPFGVADDTDIYRPDAKNNVMILLDSSGSMGFGTYEHAIPYDRGYKYTCELSGTGSWIVYDYKNDGGGGPSGTAATHYVNNDFKIANHIYLVRAPVGAASDSNGNYFAGDTGNDWLIWDVNNAIDTGAVLNSDGTVTDGTLLKFVTGSGGEPVVALNGTTFLKNGSEIKAHIWQSNPDGTQVDTGFAGLMQAPGHLFTGRFSDKNVSPNSTIADMTSVFADAEADAYGKEYAYFFAVGNWINMQMYAGLRSYDGSSWDFSWRQVTYPLPSGVATAVSYDRASANYPNDYPKNYDSQNDAAVLSGNLYELVNTLAGEIRIHFDAFDLASGDKLEFFDDKGSSVYSITGSASLSSLQTGGYTPWFTTSKLTWRFTTNKWNQDTGWHMDRYEYRPAGSLYKMQTRKEVIVEAMSQILLETRIGEELNWGLMTFDHTGGSNGGTVKQSINPSFQDDQSRQNIFNHMDKVVPAGGTPLGEALQDAFLSFKANIHRDCIRNFVITLTDGFPSADDDWTRISGVNFADSAWHDSMQFTADPVQYTNPAPNYYDDVAQYMFTHSWLDKSLIPEAERATSPDNITLHNIGFSIDNPMLAYASDPDGPSEAKLGNGLYLTAFSKTQVYSAFYSLGLLIAQYTSYTAPVVSVNEANRLESGDEIYLAVFKPDSSDYWAGNLKKYGLTFGVRPACGDTAQPYMLDRNGTEAANCDGILLPNTQSYWNAMDDGGTVERGGVGELILKRVQAATKSPLEEPYAASLRTIKTSLDGATLVTFAVDTLTNTDLGVSDDLTRQKIVNFMYGYTYDADVATGAPLAVRDWPLGAIIHSEPRIIEYFDSQYQLTKRYLAVGANDSMLHVFDDETGEEVFAFVPPALLTNLTSYDPATGSFKVYGVDAPPTLVRVPTATGGEERHLVFGLRRGGRALYALNVTDSNPANWTLAWTIDQNASGMSELAQTWAEAKFTKVQVGVNSGNPVYQKLMILPGGYDPLEDNYPSDLTKDYKIAPDFKDGMGRAIYLLDAETAQPIDLKGGTVFDTPVAMPATGANEIDQFEYPGDAWVAANPKTELARLRYCFPSRATVLNNRNGVLLAAYISDIYGQVWKLTSHYDESAGRAIIDLNLIFKTNPETDQASALTRQNDFASWNFGDPDPRTTINYQTTTSGGVSGYIVNPRKVLTPPMVSYSGSDDYNGRVIVLGTGDRTKPQYANNKDGIYTFFDAHDYYVKNRKANAAYLPSVIPASLSDYEPSLAFTEKELLNVSCGAIEPDETSVTAAIKAKIRSWLQFEAKGWFIKFADIDSACPIYLYGELDKHKGEMVASEITLVDGVVYVPTYQPTLDTSQDSCGDIGTARIWAVYLISGNAVFNFYRGNDGTTDPDNPEAKYQRHDRYVSVGQLFPSSVTPVFKDSEEDGPCGSYAGGILNVDGGSKPVEFADQCNGMVPYYWTEIRR